jgi:alpha-tubulin suppressor-like RCC1 family protein
VPGITNAIQLAAGNDHACALLQDGTIRCWGKNNFGQLGDGTGVNTGTSGVPTVAVANLTGVVGITAGFEHTCALLGTGNVQCWGQNEDNFGQVGDNTFRDRFVPVPVAW